MAVHGKYLFVLDSTQAIVGERSTSYSLHVVDLERLLEEPPAESDAALFDQSICSFPLETTEDECHFAEFAQSSVCDLSWKGKGFEGCMAINYCAFYDACSPYDESRDFAMFSVVFKPGSSAFPSSLTWAVTPNMTRALLNSRTNRLKPQNRVSSNGTCLLELSTKFSLWDIANYPRTGAGGTLILFKSDQSGRVGCAKIKKGQLSAYLCPEDRLFFFGRKYVVFQDPHSNALLCYRQSGGQRLGCNVVDICYPD